jgi:hypothetical protein
VSQHTLRALRQGKPVADDVLQRLASAADELTREGSHTQFEAEYWLGVARELAQELGGRNKLAKPLGVSGPYLGRCSRGERPMTKGLAERVAQVSSSDLTGRSSDS